jgi:hypothetical protein
VTEENSEGSVRGVVAQAIAVIDAGRDYAYSWAASLDAITAEIERLSDRDVRAVAVALAYYLSTQMVPASGVTFGVWLEALRCYQPERRSGAGCDE